MGEDASSPVEIQTSIKSKGGIRIGRTDAASSEQSNEYYGQRVRPELRHTSLPHCPQIWERNTIPGQ